LALRPNQGKVFVHHQQLSQQTSCRSRNQYKKTICYLCTASHSSCATSKTSNLSVTSAPLSPNIVLSFNTLLDRQASLRSCQQADTETSCRAESEEVRRHSGNWCYCMLSHPIQAVQREERMCPGRILDPWQMAIDGRPADNINRGDGACGKTSLLNVFTRG